MPPWGLFGGQPGGRSRSVIIGPDGQERRLSSKETTFVEADHLIVTETPGGGGWGDPKLRDPQAVRRDVLEGLVSAERAREVYRVSINPGTMTIDESETRALQSGVMSGTQDDESE